MDFCTDEQRDISSPIEQHVEQEENQESSRFIHYSSPTTTTILSTPTITLHSSDVPVQQQEPSISAKEGNEVIITSNTSNNDATSESFLAKFYLYISVFFSLFLQFFECESMFMLVDLDALYPSSPSVEPLSETFKESTTTATFDSSFSSVFSASFSDFTEHSQIPTHISSICNIATNSNTTTTTTTTNITKTTCKPSLSRKSSIVILLDNAPIINPSKESRKMSISLIELDTPTSIYSDDIQDFDDYSSSQCMSDAISTTTDSLIDIDFLCCNVNTFTPAAIPPRMFSKRASSPKFLNTLNPKDAFLKQNSTSKLIRSNVNREEIFELKSRLNSFKFPVKDDE